MTRKNFSQNPKFESENYKNHNNKKQKLQSRFKWTSKPLPNLLLCTKKSQKLSLTPMQTMVVQLSVKQFSHKKH